MFGAEYDSEIINKVDELIRRAISDGLLVVPEEKKKELYTGPKFYYNDCYSRTIKVEYYKDGKVKSFWIARVKSTRYTRQW